MRISSVLGPCKHSMPATFKSHIFLWRLDKVIHPLCVLDRTQSVTLRDDKRHWHSIDLTQIDKWSDAATFFKPLFDRLKLLDSFHSGKLVEVQHGGQRQTELILTVRVVRLVSFAVDSWLKSLKENYIVGPNEDLAFLEKLGILVWRSCPSRV